MINYMSLLGDFGKAVKSDHIDTCDDTYALVESRRRLVEEESQELLEALEDSLEGRGDLTHTAKELADVLYVVFGTAEALRIPMDEVFLLVHESNMKKVYPDGSPPPQNEWGKFIKPSGWVSPDSKIKILLEGGLPVS